MFEAEEEKTFKNCFQAGIQNDDVFDEDDDDYDDDDDGDDDDCCCFCFYCWSCKDWTRKTVSTNFKVKVWKKNRKRRQEESQQKWKRSCELKL